MPNFLCDNCGRTLEAPSGSEGMRATCPACCAQVQVPTDPAASVVWPPRRLVALAQRLATTQSSQAEPKARRYSTSYAADESDVRPRFKEAAITAAAQHATAVSRSIAYVVATTVFAALVVAVLLYNRGIQVDSGWIAGLISSAFIGLCLSANYWLTRDSAYEEALERERCHTIDEASEPKNWSIATSISIVFALMTGIRAFTMVAKGRGAAVAGPDAAIVLVVIGSLAIGVTSLWHAGRRYGVMRAVSMAYILASIGFAAVGYVTALPVRHVAIVRNPVEVGPRAKSAKERAAEKKAATDEIVAGWCVAPKNHSEIRGLIKNCGHDKIAFIMIEAAGLTADLRGPMCDLIREKGGVYFTLNPTSDGRFYEALAAPIDDLDAFAKRLTPFEILEIDKWRQRIVVRPDLVRLQHLAERNEADLLKRLSGGSDSSHADLVEKTRQLHRPDEIVTIDILNPESGFGSNRHAVYLHLKTYGEILSIIRNPRAQTLHYIIKHSGNFPKFVEKLDLGVVVAVNWPKRTVTVDLKRRVTSPDRFGFENLLVLESSQLGVERTRLGELYGAERVVLVRVYGMPDDSAERDFVAKLIRSGQESFRVIRANPGGWCFLVAPIDEFNDYCGKFGLFRTMSVETRYGEIRIEVDRSRVRERMRAGTR